MFVGSTTMSKFEDFDFPLVGGGGGGGGGLCLLF